MILSILFLVFTGFSSYSQDFQEKLYTSYLKGDMGVWAEVLNNLEQSYKTTNSNETLFNILHTQYGLIGYQIGLKNYSESKKLIEKAENNIEKLLSSNNKWVEVISLKSAIMAYKIAINPYKAPFLGPASNDLIEQALQLDSENPIALIEKGNAKHYAPSFVGGNPVEAQGFYKKAIQKIEGNSDKNLTRTWWYLNANTQLALSAEKAGNIKLARDTYDYILKIAPNFQWVKNELYPQFLKKIKGKV